MKALAVARKSLLEWLREPQLLILVIFAPLAFLAATMASYGRPFLDTHTVLVVNQAAQGQALIERIKAQRYADQRPCFEVQELSAAAAGPRHDNLSANALAAAGEQALQDQSAAVLIKIEPGTEKTALVVTLRGDALNGRYYEATTLLNSLIQEYADQLSGFEPAVKIVEEPAGLPPDGRAFSGPQHEYDLFVPGMIVFAILLLIPQTAMLLGREVRLGTLKRLRLSPLSAFELHAGIALAQIAVASLQVGVILACAAWMGFHNQGSLLLTMAISLVIAISAIGQGLAVACFSANDSQAVNYGSTVTMLEVFVSGAFFPMPAEALVSIAGHELTLFDLIPATSGMLMLQQVSSYGAGWHEIALRMGLTLGLSFIYLVLGVIVFNRLQMKRG